MEQHNHAEDDSEPYIGSHVLKMVDFLFMPGSARRYFLNSDKYNNSKISKLHFYSLIPISFLFEVGRIHAYNDAFKGLVNLVTNQ